MHIMCRLQIRKMFKIYVAHVYVHMYVSVCVYHIVNAVTDMVGSSSHSNSSTGFILGALPRHCILHVLTVIKEAMLKV